VAGDRSGLRSGMCELSIIIVNWNSRQFIHDCLDSIYSLPQDVIFESIVIDNNSTDGSRELIRTEFPAVRLIENPANLGFAAANNQGARLAEGRFLLFLNSDTLVHPGTLAGAVAFMEQHPEAGIMGCRTLNSDGSLQATAFAFPSKLRIFAYVSGLNRFFKISRFTDHSALCTPDYVQGSFLVIRKDVFEKCGGFDEFFFLYAEETDLCLRIKAAGLAVYYYPDISITHFGGGSSKNSLAGLGHFVKSSIGFYQKHRPLPEVKKLRQVLKAALHLRIVGGIVLSPLNFRTRKKEIKSILLDLPDVHNEQLK
jgi:GT2 family glycosyltransferase